MITNSKIGFNGRFGNQLFQFASTVGIAEKNGYEAVFPHYNIVNGKLQYLNDGQEYMAKIDFVDCFDIDSKYFSNNINVYNNINERFFHFDENLFTIQDGTDINGYLQSEKYFKHCSDKIKSILKFKKNIKEEASKLLPVTDKELVSIHVRRSDYLKQSNFHPWIGEEYLNKSIQMFDEKEHHFVVCSDDYDWCNNKWGNNENFTVIKSSSYFVDFAVLSLCSHHIISNSSFSWWSSYLSDNKDKKVIAPAIWFGINAMHNNTKDLYRENMIKI